MSNCIWTEQLIAEINVNIGLLNAGLAWYAEFITIRFLHAWICRTISYIIHIQSLWSYNGQYSIIHYVIELNVNEICDSQTLPRNFNIWITHKVPSAFTLAWVLLVWTCLLFLLVWESYGRLHTHATLVIVMWLVSMLQYSWLHFSFRCTVDFA